MPTDLTGGLKIEYKYQFIEEIRYAEVKFLDYSFYAAGHFYGAVTTDLLQHPTPTFVRYASTIADNPTLAFGVILGDVVGVPTDNAYERVIFAMQSTGKDYYALPGNHDEADGGALFEKYMGDKYRTFKRGNSLFILLDSRVEENGISADGAQAEMIRAALAENPGALNIFVFTHELIWLDANDPRFSGFAPNSYADYTSAMPNTFKTFLLPLFQATGANLYFIAGDSGAFANGNEIFYGKYDGVTYIANGFGSGTHDNILQFNIYTSGDVTIDLIALNGEDPNALGSIYDYKRSELSE